MTAMEFNQELERAMDPIRSFAYKLTRCEEAAKDLVQETLCRAFTNREKFQVGTNFPAWITTILKNTFINHYRQARARGKAPISVEDNLYWLENRATVGDAAAPAEYAELMEIVARLKDTYRIPFMLFYQGYHYDEIARVMGIPMGTVKSRIFYARDCLRRMIRSAHGAQAAVD